jgi:Xaa-Pro aminopeptidase
MVNENRNFLKAKTRESPQTTFLARWLYGFLEEKGTVLFFGKLNHPLFTFCIFLILLLNSFSSPSKETDMKKSLRFIVAPVALFVLTALTASSLSAGLIFDKSEYAARRQKFLEKIPDGTAVIFGAQPIGSYYPYAQSNDFLYLCGVELPNAALVIDGVRKTCALFFTSSEAAARNNGIGADIVKNSREVTGIDVILPYENLANQLMAISNGAKIVYTPFRPEELYREASLEKFRTLMQNMVLNPWDGRTTRELQFVKILKERFPQLEVRDCSSLIWELRTIKSPAEIELMRKVGRIGVKAHTTLMQATRPGMMEYELSAVLNYFCEKEGAQESAYGVIISSGENHPYVHYAEHDRQLKDGDIIVVDAGPDLNYYDIDITITYPANGKFSPRQKEVYEAALAIHEANMKVYRPGLTSAQCRQEVEEILKKQGFDLTKDHFKRLRGGFGHYVGMATHDVGGGPQTLKPGMVFANEPMIIYAE